jgi:hypothetical protein
MELTFIIVLYLYCPIQLNSCIRAIRLATRYYCFTQSSLLLYFDCTNPWTGDFVYLALQPTEINYICMRLPYVSYPYINLLMWSQFILCWNNYIIQQHKIKTLYFPGLDVHGMSCVEYFRCRPKCSESGMSSRKGVGLSQEGCGWLKPPPILLYFGSTLSLHWSCRTWETCRTHKFIPMGASSFGVPWYMFVVWSPQYASSFGVGPACLLYRLCGSSL